MNRTATAIFALALTATSGAAQDQSLLDGCTLQALDRVPKVGGIRVANTSVQHRNSFEQFEFWTVTVVVEFNGRPVNYQFICRIFDNAEATILRGAPVSSGSSSSAAVHEVTTTNLPSAPAVPAEGAIKLAPVQGKTIAPGVTMTPQPTAPATYQRR